jgi:cytochrome subunit of sulfide dehydrogenase
MKSRVARVATSVSMSVALLVGCCAAHAGDGLPGRDIAANCASCHGTDGRSLGAIPVLAGRDKAELVALVREFRDGTRPSTVMRQLAKGYTDAQIEAVAAYFSAQKPN